MALSMQDAGYKVIVLTNTLANKAYYNKTTGQYAYKNIEYRSYYKPNLSRFKRIINRYDIKQILKSTLKPTERKNVCLIVSSYKNYSIILRLFSKRYKLPELVDVTEWHSSFQFNFGRFNLKYLLHDLKNRFLIPKAKNVICVSKYLENYYKLRKCNTFYLPPPIVINDYLPHTLPHLPPVTFFYAGSIQKKDFIEIALAGFAMLNKAEKEKIKIIIAGCDKETLKEQLPNGKKLINNLGNILSVVGRISKDEVEQYLSKSHFLFLLRPVARYSKAGFPSKIPEALASGVPVIVNLTSDLGNFIFEFKNGIIVNKLAAKEFAIAVRKALGLTEEKFTTMSNNAHLSAKENFDYTNYNQTMEKYLNDILSA
ncbi:hypothetical protein FMIA91_17830 [Fidelibacter multiformis]